MEEQKPLYSIGQAVEWVIGPCLVQSVEVADGRYYYHLKHRDYDLAGRASEETLVQTVICSFPRQTPSILIVDNFYSDPVAIRKLALEQEYHLNAKAYKGKRSARVLLPGLREQFERLLGTKIANWLQHSANGSFQITKYTDPLVYHSDHQSYAAAVYLTPGPVGAGTSFWRDKKYGCRRPPFHGKEQDRFANDVERKTAQDEIYSEYNLLHPDNWELVDRVGSVFNRLVIWDAQIIHSATSYADFSGEKEVEKEKENYRLVQLFFFDVEK